MTSSPKKSKRGRPPKPGGAVSPAERMRAYRQRRKAAGVVVRRLSPGERREWNAFKANAKSRKRLKALLAQMQALEKEYERLSHENEQLERALADEASP